MRTVNSLVNKKYILAEGILQLLKGGLLHSGILLVYTCLTYITYMIENLPLDFVERFLKGALKNILFFMIIVWLGYTLFYFLKQKSISNMRLCCWFWIMKTIGVYFGGAWFVYFLVNRIPEIMSGGLLEKMGLIYILFIICVDAISRLIQKRCGFLKFK